MLPHHHTRPGWIALGLVGIAKAFEEQRALPTVTSLTFEERLGLLVDREAVERESKRLVTRLKFANLRQNATIEDLNTKAARGLDKALFAKLATRRLDEPGDGPLGSPAKPARARAGLPARSHTRHAVTIDRCFTIAWPRLLDSLALARGDGRYVRLLKSLLGSC